MAKTKNSMTSQPDVAAALALAREAVSLLAGTPDDPQCDAALWRLVDAAGLLAAGTNSIVGSEDNPTGRGFYVGQS
jgi:hypothetical protein